MLNHRNILSNAEAVANGTNDYENELLVSFTGGGYVLSMIMDCPTGFPRSVYDLPVIKPTRIISAARLYEYFYEQLHCKYLDNWFLIRFLFKETVKLGWSLFEYKHGRGAWKPKFLLFPILDKIIANPVRNLFGGRLRCGFYAGGILPPEIYKTFIGLGIPVLNCYGQAEAAPVISINTPEDNVPSSVGKPIKGTEVMLKNVELLVKSSGVMMGYWNNTSATESTLKDGWLHTGDMVRIDNDGRLFFIGRMADVITMKNGDKIAPTEIEAIIKADILFEQVMVIGKEKPFFTALLVLNKELWEKMAKSLKLNPNDPLALKNNTLKNLILNRIAEKMVNYPDAVQIRRVTLLIDEWTAKSGLMTISSKLKRNNISAKYAEEINDMYLS
ncbi:long-chain fatty-acid-CoA ligase [Candidatus Magnetoovum chiemensis]|nr:long-chain fatty-acid-CoA ligase [Candidatus Magnetoovum chiemensis]